MSGLSLAKRSLKNGLAALGVELRRIRPPEGSTANGRYSNFNEEGIIKGLVAKLSVKHRFCVDIGAGDGETSSNSCFLYKDGWEGLSVEWDGGRFALMAYRYSQFKGARLCRAKVTPENVIELLAGAETPKEFGFLSLDIDSYDHFVLERILSAYRPNVICAEINEKIPPPVRFTVKWSPDHGWSYDHFYGQSLSILEDLGKRHGYALAGLEYNNAFLIPKESAGIPLLTAEQAYRRGYQDRPDRLQRLPWNKDMESLLSMAPEEKAAFVRTHFAKYEGRFLCSAQPIP